LDLTQSVVSTIVKSVSADFSRAQLPWLSARYFSP
jgi:hypothetical protein